jgi:conjugal transfer pilus assembly protein TraU
MRTPLVVFLCCLSIVIYPSAFAATCRGHIINPVTDVCWRCLFPITIGSSTVVSSDLPDAPNPHKTFCVCKKDPFPIIGLAMGYWEPIALVDVTRTPYCFVNLGGLHLNSESNAAGVVETQRPDQNGGFYYVHVYHFPILQWVDTGLLGGSCQSRGQFEVVYFSELDPTWRNESLALIAFPETKQFLKPDVALRAQASCLLDSTLANTQLPSDTAYWCAGSQGFMYPLTGKVVEQVGSVQASTLLAERVLFKLHRLGNIRDTHAETLCSENINLIMPKSRYRYQMVYPRATACYPFGRTTALWGSNIMNPLKGDDTGYLIWRKRNCCNWGS